MRNYFFALAVMTLATGSSLQADTTIWLGGGWRSDHLNWSIGIPDVGPDVLSELEWEQIRMWNITGGIKGGICQDWYFRINGDYGKIYDGKNRDSDYFQNNRQALFFRSDSKADRGEAFDISLALGYPIYFCSGQWEIIPLIGYSRMEQHLVIRKGFITFSIFDDKGEPITGLNSRYDAKWSTLWLGIDFKYEVTCGLDLFGTLEYHRAFYKGTGDWNLREDFVDDFKHEANDANGFVGMIGAKYSWFSGLGLALELWYKYFKTQHGTEKTSFAAPGGTGSDPVALRARLNEVEWHSFRILGTLTYDF